MVAKGSYGMELRNDRYCYWLVLVGGLNDSLTPLPLLKRILRFVVFIKRSCEPLLAILLILVNTSYFLNRELCSEQSGQRKCLQKCTMASQGLGRISGQPGTLFGFVSNGTGS